MNLSLGKLRALATLSDAQGIFTILALDHDVSFRTMFWGDAWEQAPHGEVVRSKMEIVRLLAPHTTAVLLDPLYGFAGAISTQALPGNVGLMSVIDDEAVASPDPAVTTGLIQGWSVPQAKRLGATGIKVYFFYNHREAEPAAREEAVICKLVEECAQAELPLFAEPIHYGVEPNARRRLVIENARRISDLGADVLKLEFPVDVRVEPDERIWRDACEELSQALPRPWTLLSAGVDYATFRRQAEVACAAGASGFVAGRAIWQEASDLDGAARTAFLQNVAAARLQELSVLGNRYGRSWRAFFDAAPVAPDWYMTYPGTL